MDNDNVQALCSAVVDAWRPLLDLGGLLTTSVTEDLEVVCAYLAQFNETNEGPFVHNCVAVHACLRLIEVLGNTILMTATFAGEGINPRPAD